MRHRPLLAGATFIVAAAAIAYFDRNAAWRVAMPTTARPHSARRTHAAPIAEPAVGVDKSTRQSVTRLGTVRATASEPLPPPGAPLAQTFDALQARADAGDVQAASRLYHDLHKCARLQQIRRTLPIIVAMDPGHPRPEAQSADDLKREQRVLDWEQRDLDFVRDNEPLCDGLDKQQLDSIVPAALRAAKLGDEQALDCYIGSSSHQMPDLLNHPEWLTDYKRNAPALVQSALHNGDWVIVGLLQFAYQGGFDASFLNQMIDPDPVMYYRYLRLQRLGASGNFADKLDKLIDQAARQLSAAEITDADAWASDTYTRYFNGSSSNVNHNGVNTCRGSDE